MMKKSVRFGVTEPIRTEPNGRLGQPGAAWTARLHVARASFFTGLLCAS